MGPAGAVAAAGSGGGGSSAPASTWRAYGDTAAAVGEPTATAESSSGSGGAGAGGSSSSSSRSSCGGGRAPGGSHGENGFPERIGNGGGLRRAGAVAGGGKVGLIGFAREQAGAMLSVPEEDGDTSLTIGTGSRAPFTTSTGGGSAGGGSGDSAMSGACSGGRDGAGVGAASRAVGGLASSTKAAQGTATVATGGDNGEFTPPLGSEQTDTASCSSGGGGGGGGGDGRHDASATSGLLGGGSTSGSGLALEGNGKTGKVRAARGEAETPRGLSNLIRFRELCLPRLRFPRYKYFSMLSSFLFFFRTAERHSINRAGGVSLSPFQRRAIS